MTRYWVIAPFAAKNAAIFDKVWQFDLANNIIAIGWSHLGDVSKMVREVLTETVAELHIVSSFGRSSDESSLS